MEARGTRSQGRGRSPGCDSAPRYSFPNDQCMACSSKNHRRADCPVYGKVMKANGGQRRHQTAKSHAAHTAKFQCLSNRSSLPSRLATCQERPKCTLCFGTVSRPSRSTARAPRTRRSLKVTWGPSNSGKGRSLITYMIRQAVGVSSPRRPKRAPADHKGVPPGHPRGCWRTCVDHRLGSRELLGKVVRRGDVQSQGSALRRGR